MGKSNGAPQPGSSILHQAQAYALRVAPLFEPATPIINLQYQVFCTSPQADAGIAGLPVTDRVCHGLLRDPEKMHCRTVVLN